MARLSILILTHKRPKLFQRCLKSALHPGIEILVNNDSNDVVCPENIKLFHKQGTLTEKYQFLVEQASGDYVYFLEDDDVLFPAFFKVLGLLDNKDCYCGSYFIADSHIPFKDRSIRFNPNHEFQLSQCIFKKICLNFNNLKSCKSGESCIFNDYYLFKQSVKDYQVLDILFFRQTIDGKDNISFLETSDLNKCKMCPWSRFNSDNSQ